jgi:hypothetical protein
MGGDGSRTANPPSGSRRKPKHGPKKPTLRLLSTPTVVTANGKAPPDFVVRIPDALLDDIKAFIRRFVVVTDAQLLVVALWVVHTHCLDAALQTPYLAVTSPEKECGKSRLEEVVALLVKQPWKAVLPSEAVLFRKIDRSRPTLLLDEADAIFAPGRNSDRYEATRALLNAGHRRGETVSRCVGPNHATQDFKVFCAKMIAGIGTLPDTVAGRSFPIRLQRKTKTEHTDRFIHRDVEPAAKALRQQIEAWSAEHLEDRSQARPDIPDELNDREQEGGEPLLAIADALGCGQAAREALVELCTGGRVDNVDSARLRLLKDIRRIYRACDRRCGYRIKGMPTTKLLKRLHALPESEWRHYYGRRLEPKDLSALLRPYEVHPVAIRFRTSVKKGYRRADLVQVWERYL